MMEGSVELILTALLFMKCLVGFTVNLILVAANFLKWKSRKSLQTSDKILSSLAISRLLCFLSMALWNFLFQVSPWLVENYIVVLTLYVVTMFVFYSSHWFATILCVFYCVKIVTYNCKLLFFLKTKIPTIVQWLILASLLISLISSLPFGWLGYDLRLQNLSNVSTENITEFRLVLLPKSIEQYIIFTVGSIPLFLLFCIANSLLIQFLLFHTRRMKSNESPIQRPNLRCHFTALKKCLISSFPFVFVG
ncbi:taste receptor type 2 member 40-like [Ranitomeya imitator]|uniref:taste receptor type 2 member 40-like n=1 Tax=Ranitomeya imitator TaxID=111125 RepID=UPI0037E941E0